MDFSEKWGKDVETATALALDELKCSKDEVKITVLEEPSRGFLGIGSKLAKVRVEKIEVSENDKTEKIEVKEEVNETVTEETVENETTEVTSNKLIRPDNMKEIEEHPALSFLKETTEKMGLELSFKAYADDNNVFIDIAGKDAGTIIGKRGQTLDAIQYLTSLAVNKKSEDYVRVVLDAENYRSKREKTLERLAHRLADKVVRTKRSVKLEPMNPYERMVIHAALVNSPKVKTRSEGEEPYRRVVIELK
ncbi:RNA-binding cell elongation regulator Jag/EloR [Gallibacter intestinalis]|uniref:RNA-binding protein KhpB n=1 Tax=Gallibacter intestinalis TaxID=2779356 RepID=A0ABR9QXF3_9FIRM|nr:RNA-binding cell elongation regulator Jag/EloR [Gallibacter intestinalis]MBE5035548.1 protein jag [Gallibacter intestinalis]